MLQAQSPNLDRSLVVQLLLEFHSVLTNLHAWETGLCSFHSGSLWWPISSAFSFNSTDTHIDSTFPVSYHFPNILTANTLTHYWAFSAVVLSNIRLLTDPSNELFVPASCSGSDFRNEMKNLASKICQSMEFHLLPELKLYGPISTFFPIWIALQIFERSLEMKKEEQWCRNFIEILEERGFPLAKFLPGCPGI